MAEVQGAVQTAVVSSAVVGLAYYMNKPMYPVTDSEMVVLGLSCKHIYVWFGDAQTNGTIQPYLYAEFTGAEEHEWPSILPRRRLGGEEVDSGFPLGDQTNDPNYVSRSNNGQINAEEDVQFKLLVDGKTRLLSVLRNGFRHENMLTAAVFHHLKKLGDTELTASLTAFQRSVFVAVHLSRKTPVRVDSVDQRADGVCHLIFTSNAMADLFRDGKLVNMKRLSLAKVNEHVNEGLEDYICDMVPIEAPYNLYKRYRYFQTTKSNAKKFAIRAYPYCCFETKYHTNAVRQHVESNISDNIPLVIGTALGTHEPEDFLGFWFYAFQTHLHIRFILENTYLSRFTSSNPNNFSLLYNASMRPLLGEMVDKDFVFNPLEHVTNVTFEKSEPKDNKAMMFHRNRKFGFTLEMYIMYPSLILIEQFIKGSSRTPLTFTRVKVRGVFVLTKDEKATGSKKTIYNFDHKKTIEISWFKE